MTDSEYIFLYPWLQADENWAGFHVDYVGDAASFSAALNRLAKDPALQAPDPRLPCFIPVVTPECITSVNALADRNAVFLIRSGNRELETELRNRGAKLGLLLAPEAPLPAAGVWDYVILAASHARTLPPYCLVNLASSSAIGITGLKSRSDFSWAIANQCSLVTGEYLLNRSSSCAKLDMARVRLLKLLVLIANDADTREIEEVFRQEPKLAYGLLRLVNSAATSHRDPIINFAQAITLLGRQQLQRWLQLLVYADPNDGQPSNPLLLQAATRGRLMEILADKVSPAQERGFNSDTAFMVGTFSLLDVLLHLPMPEILQQLPLSATAKAALEQHQGFLGELLTALCAADSRDLETAGRRLGVLGIDSNDFIAAQLTALQWANVIRTNS